MSPDGNYGTDRETAVKNEVETYGNMRMSVLKVVARFGEVIFIFIINLVISAFVMLLSGMLVLTQILFIVYVMFLSVSFVLAMFPGCESLLRKSLSWLYAVDNGCIYDIYSDLWAIWWTCFCDDWLFADCGFCRDLLCKEGYPWYGVGAGRWRY